MDDVTKKLNKINQLITELEWALLGWVAVLSGERYHRTWLDAGENRQFKIYVRKGVHCIHTATNCLILANMDFGETQEIDVFPRLISMLERVNPWDALFIENITDKPLVDHLLERGYKLATEAANCYYRHQIKRKCEWDKFERATESTLDPVMLQVAIDTGILNDEIYVNSLYQVNIRRGIKPNEGFPEVIHLSIKTRNKDAAHDWRDFQRIKNELIGPENEGFEMYPAQSRLVDTSNQFHMFVFADPTVRLPVGFFSRLICKDSGHGAIQRPFYDNEVPNDAITAKEIMARYQQQSTPPPPNEPATNTTP